MAEKKKLSAVEGFKENSRFLRGNIALELASDADKFEEAEKQLLKFHGTYQQDDRDVRKERSKEGLGRYFMFMVRARIPGGKVTADQYLTMDRLADQYANGTLRITSRQGIQFHGIVKKDLKATIAGINECLLSTLGACGDVERNVMAPPPPFAASAYQELQSKADAIAKHLAPRSRAYHEIWLNGKQVENERKPKKESEPIYGKVYLPRKFKTGLALPDDNSIDIYAQCLGFLADVEHDEIVGYDVLVGGGMGMTHGNSKTYPYLARPICYIKPDQVIKTAEAVVKLFRDHGDRSDRKHARIKYLVSEWGVEKFREVIAGYLDFPLVLPKNIEVKGFPLHLGWHAQGDGKFFYGISVESGRIKDEGALRLRTALRTLVERLKPNIRLTPVQDILLCDLPESALTEIEATLKEYGIAAPENVSRTRQHSLACPAIPTCGLALSESERALPELIDEFDAELQKLGLQDELISIRMTGCPNGCVRPYQSDIGIVGRSGDKYTLFVGGNVIGTRLNFMLKDLVPRDEIVPLLSAVLKDFKRKRGADESFGDYCHRVGEKKLQEMAERGSQLRHYTIDVKLYELDKDGRTSTLPMPQASVAEGDEYSVGDARQCIALRHGTIRDLLPADNGAIASNGREPAETLDAGIVWKGKIAATEDDRVSVDLSFCSNDVNSADLEGIVMTGRWMRVVRKMRLGQNTEVVIDRDSEGKPARWLEVVVNDSGR